MKAVLLLTVCLALPGCFRPLGTVGADFSKLGLVTPQRADDDVENGDRMPTVTLPATLATLRLQGHHGGGLCSPESARTAEEDRGIHRLGRLPGVSAVVPLSSLVCPNPMRSSADIRQAAAAAGADLALVYTFNSSVDSERTIPLIGLPTLGVFPNWIALGTCTASAALIDVDSGHLYIVTEVTAVDNRITNFWSVHTAMGRAHRGSERWAFEKLIGQIEKSWGGVKHRVDAGAGGTAPMGL